MQCWGDGWPNGRVSQDDMIKLFSESRVNLNLTKSSGIFGLKPFVKLLFRRWVDGTYHLYSPVSWVNNVKSLYDKRREQIKGRNFEVPGSGGFLLTSDADNLGDYYENGKEIVIFENTEEMIEKIKYYLSHEDERQRIAEAGYRRTLRDHTYEKRFNEIFKIMGLK